MTFALDARHVFMLCLACLVTAGQSAPAAARASEGQRMLRIPVLRGDNGLPVPCAEDPSCHNRFHPDIPPRAVARPGSVVIFETRDALDNQVDFDSTAIDAALADPNRIHPLTGPVYIEGAEAGDVLEVSMLRIEPGPDAFG